MVALLAAPRMHCLACVPTCGRVAVCTITPDPDAGVRQGVQAQLGRACVSEQRWLAPFCVLCPVLSGVLPGHCPHTCSLLGTLVAVLASGLWWAAAEKAQGRCLGE